MSDSQPTARIPVQGADGTPDIHGTTSADTGAPATPSTERKDPARRPHRPGTIIWGLVVAVIGAGILARALGAEFDNDLALIVLLGAAGVALLLASIFSAVSRR